MSRRPRKPVEAKKEIYEPKQPPQILHDGMNEEQRKFAIDTSLEALFKFQIEKDIATHLKQKFDEKFEGTWQAIVGKTFGCSLSYEAKTLFYYKIDDMHFVVFKSKDNVSLVTQ
eukprot:TRINITY_DN4026_c0_g1_i1.p1 TRINITY_DN4026_c0_g1~~TRINITY_DN4026_c0_g1_i1.p1  ORF type:complete len:114 (-),score=19.77 TRINITY_DN4026_c0_g1_i1:224-565(-)